VATLPKPVVLLTSALNPLAVVPAGVIALKSLKTGGGITVGSGVVQKRLITVSRVVRASGVVT
jgi:hypothetical protein